MSELPLLYPDWPPVPGVHALSTRRGGGVSAGVYATLNLGDHVGDEPSHVIENRRRLRAAARLPAEPCWLRQVHGNRVIDLDASPADLTGDAALTRRTGVVCAVLTADCLPVLFTARSGACIAAAHAGWRGLAAGVLETVVAAMGLPPAQLQAWIGPGIGPGHFEVGPEVREVFVDVDAGAASCFKAKDGRFMADLGGLARRRLARLGVGRVDSADECTFADVRSCFSHRREGRCGRHATLIWKS